MSKPKEKIYGVADRAWQVVVGCDPHMPCAPRCWARKTVARVVECQGEKTRALFQIALTPDKQRWSGEVRLDEQHLNDPLRWRSVGALVATGFHGDLFRLSGGDILRVMDVVARASWHRFLLLTKCPDRALDWMQRWADTKEADYEPKLARGPEAVRKVHTCGRALLFADMLEVMGKPPKGCAYSTYDWMEGMCRWPSVFRNASIGCSVMNQAEADRMRESMCAIAALGWNTHVWYEPALGPVSWRGWEFLRGMISGGESGKGSRPSHPDWHRATRDWCVRNGVPFNFKQWGDWAPCGPMEQDAGFPGGTAFQSARGGRVFGAAVIRMRSRYRSLEDGAIMERVGKKKAGRLLDGCTWDELPAFGSRAAMGKHEEKMA